MNIKQLSDIVSDKTKNALIVEHPIFTGRIDIYVPAKSIEILTYELSLVMPISIAWRVLLLDRDDINGIVHSIL